MIPARAPYTAPQLGNVYNRDEVRTAITNLARSVPPQITRNVTAAYTATTADDLIVCDATGGAFTVTLPAADQVQFLRLSVIRINGGGNAITIGGTVSGAVNPTLASQYAAITVQSNGTAWYKLSGI